MTPKTKQTRDEILDAAMRLAQREGFAALRRDAIGAEAGVSFGLVTIRLGTMDNVRRAVMRRAVRERCLRVIAEGIAIRDKHALRAPDDLKDEAIQWLAAQRG